MSKLEEYRQEIDAIDQELTRLFEARLKTVLKVGEYKKQHDLSVLDASREQKVIAKNVDRLEDKQFKEELTKFFQSMMDITKETQQKMME